MTAEIITLKRARKAKARAAKDETAARNRAASGRTKAERTKTAAETERAAKVLDGSAISAANESGFSPAAAHDDEDLDPGNVS